MDVWGVRDGEQHWRGWEDALSMKNLCLPASSSFLALWTIAASYTREGGILYIHRAVLSG